MQTMKYCIEWKLSPDSCTSIILEKASYFASRHNHSLWQIVLINVDSWIQRPAWWICGDHLEINWWILFGDYLSPHNDANTQLYDVCRAALWRVSRGAVVRSEDIVHIAMAPRLWGLNAIGTTLETARVTVNRMHNRYWATWVDKWGCEFWTGWCKGTTWAQVCGTVLCESLFETSL